MEQKVRIKKESNNSFISASNLTTKGYSDAKTYFSVPIDSATGLLKQVLEPKECEEYEKKLGLASGTMSAVNSQYWKDYQALIIGEDVLFDLSNPRQYVDYKVIMSNKKIVADGYDEFRMKPGAEWVVTSEEKEAKKINQKRDVKIRAYTHFIKMTFSEKKQFLIAIGKNPANSNEEVVQRLVGDEIEVDPARFLEVIEDKYYKEKIFINSCISAGILRKNGTSIYYGNDRIGLDVEKAADFLKAPENSELFAVIKSQIDKKKSKE